MTSADLGRRLTVSRYPRSAHYDPVWLVDNMMGPCSVWLTEALTDVMPLAAGDHVLDLGCGKAMSSIFLAREFNTHVVAADLWIGADENQRRIDDAGLAASITPIHLDATSSTSPTRRSTRSSASTPTTTSAPSRARSRTSFGSCDQAAGSASSFPPSARRSTPGPNTSPPGGKTASKRSTALRGGPTCGRAKQVVHLERADLVPQGAEDWLTWTEAWDDWARANDRAPYELESQMLRADRDHLLGFTRLVATKSDPPDRTPNLGPPAIADNRHDHDLADASEIAGSTVVVRWCAPACPCAQLARTFR